MFRRLYRQRRRMAVTTLALFVLLCVGIFLTEPGSYSDLPVSNPISWIALLLASIIVTGGVILVTTLVLPDLRHILECGIAAIALFEALRLALPAGASWPPGYDMLAFIACYLVIERLLYGQVLDAVTTGRETRRHREFRADASAPAAWQRLALLPETCASYHYPGTSMVPLPGKERGFEVSFPLRGGSNYQVEHIEIERADAPSHFVVAFEPGRQGASTGGLSGKVELSIAPERDGIRVRWTETRSGAPLRRRLQWFMDDEFGDRLDSIEASVRSRRDRSLFSRQFVRT